MNGRDCSASISGTCLALTEGSGPCDIEAGECVYGGIPAREENPVKKALIYLTTPAQTWGKEDIQHFNALYAFAKTEGYTVTEAWPVYWDGTDRAEARWMDAHELLSKGFFDAIVFWDGKFETPQLMLPHHSA